MALSWRIDKCCLFVYEIGPTGFMLICIDNKCSRPTSVTKLSLVYKKTPFSNWIFHLLLVKMDTRCSHVQAPNGVQTHIRGSNANTDQSRCLCVCVALINEFWLCICCSTAVCRVDLGINRVGVLQKKNRSSYRTPQFLLPQTQRGEISGKELALQTQDSK